MTRLKKVAPLGPMDKWFRARVFNKDIRDLATPAMGAKLLLAFIAAGAVYVSIISAPGAIGALAAGFALVMLAIAVIDQRSFIIPNWLNAIGFGLALVHAAAQEPNMIAQAVAIAALRGLALALFLFTIRVLYEKVRGRQGLGLGDVKLAFVAGAWLNWLMIPVAIELAALAALSAYLWRRLVLGQSIPPTSRIPFGLFFAPAIWVCWLLEVRWL